MSKRRTVFISIVIAFGGITHLGQQKRFGRHAWNSHRVGHPELIFAARFPEIRAALKGEKVVGYITSYPKNSRLWRRSRGWTQYALVPILVRDSLAPKFIIGDFPFGLPSPDFLIKHNLRVQAQWPRRNLWLLTHQAESP